MWTSLCNKWGGGAYLIHPVVQRHRGHVLDGLPVFDAPQFQEQVVPLAVVDPHLREAQAPDELLPQQHLHADLLLTHLDIEMRRKQSP